jgi:hypothetical protein
MRLHHLLTIRASMAAVALISLVLAFGLVPLLRKFERQKAMREYGEVANEMCSAIFALANRVPTGVNPSEWKEAVKLTAVAHFNAFHLFHPPPTEELHRLREELMPKLRGPVDIPTLAWIWDRLARTGVDGKRITDHNRQSFEKCFPPGTFPGPSRDRTQGD